MVNDKVATDLHLAWQFDAGHDLNHFEQGFVNDGKDLAQHYRPHAITPATEPINDESPKALRCPIAVMSTEVVADVLEHELARASGAGRRGCAAAAATAKQHG